MKKRIIEVDEELYRYIAGQTEQIGESASHILRRLLDLPQLEAAQPEPVLDQKPAEEFAQEQAQSLAQAPESSEDKADALLDFSRSETIFKESKAINRFMKLLSYLCQRDEAGFARATAIKGTKRTYFATTEAELLAGGGTTKPKPIPQTPYWVITNTNTGRKRTILSQLLVEMGYETDLADKVSNAI